MDIPDVGTVVVYGPPKAMSQLEQVKKSGSLQSIKYADVMIK